MIQLELVPHFDGTTYEPERDHARLSGQWLRVWNVMKTGRKLTLQQIATLTGDPESSVSARLRDFRKPRFGGITVHKKNCGGGTWVYWLEVEQ